MLVNGKVWPFLDVEPRMYRFRVLNGCNARILDLNLGGAPLWQIGAEGGMWDMPVPVKQIVLAPAERADLLVDFSKMAGKTLIVGNSNPPKPVSTPAPSLPQVMQIRVGTSVTQPGPTTIPASLPGRAADLPAPSRTRFITLNEIGAETADWFLNLNSVAFRRGTRHREPEGGHHRGLGLRQPHRRHAPDALTPGHLPGRRTHAVQRRGLRGRLRRHRPACPAGSTRHRSPPDRCSRPSPTERGFKDTVKANPGYFTTIRAKYDLPDKVKAPQTYVYHCHIVEHEDNDMMRPFTVIR